MATNRLRQGCDRFGGAPGRCMRVLMCGQLDGATCRWARPVFDRVLDERCGHALGMWHTGAVGGDEETRWSPVGPPRLWVVDAAAVSLLNLAGPRLWEDLARRCGRLGGEFVVVRPSRAVRRLLTLADPDPALRWTTAGSPSLAETGSPRVDQDAGTGRPDQALPRPSSVPSPPSGG